MTIAPIADLQRPHRGLALEAERRRQFAVGVDPRLQIGDLLLREADGIGAGDETARGCSPAIVISAWASLAGSPAAARSPTSAMISAAAPWLPGVDDARPRYKA